MLRRIAPSGQVVALLRVCRSLTLACCVLLQEMVTLSLFHFYLHCLLVGQKDDPAFETVAGVLLLLLLAHGSCLTQRGRCLIEHDLRLETEMSWGADLVFQKRLINREPRHNPTSCVSGGTVGYQTP